ncbi:hypothetical protein HK405_006379, partial [Cladochytrium tenue]
GQSIETVNMNNALRRTIEKLQHDLSQHVRREADSSKKLDKITTERSALQEELRKVQEEVRRLQSAKDGVESESAVTEKEAMSLRLQLDRLKGDFDATTKQKQVAEVGVM